MFSYKSSKFHLPQALCLKRGAHGGAAKQCATKRAAPEAKPRPRPV